MSLNIRGVLRFGYGAVAESLTQPKLRDWADKEIILGAIKYFDNIERFIEGFDSNGKVNNLDGMNNYRDIFIVDPKLRESPSKVLIQRLKNYKSLLEKVVNQSIIEPESKEQLISYFRKLSQDKDPHYNFETVEYLELGGQHKQDDI